MLNIDEIKQTQELAHKLMKQGVLQIDPYSGEVHMASEAFKANFTDYLVIDSPGHVSLNYPMRLEAESEGIKFFAILDYKEAIQELRSREAI